MHRREEIEMIDPCYTGRNMSNVIIETTWLLILNCHTSAIRNHLRSQDYINLYLALNTQRLSVLAAALEADLYF